jgi:transcriptional regulator with XRE-family HTH domain
MLGAKRARIAAGFTLKSAAKELGVSVVTLWRWEAGKQKRRPSRKSGIWLDFTESLSGVL